jgi:hypothetical protein
MPRATGGLDGVGPRTVGRPHQQGEAWGLRPPRGDGLGLLDRRVSHHDVAPLAWRGRLGVVESLQALAEQPRGVARPTAVAPGTGRPLPRSREVGLCRGPRGHDGPWEAWRPPGGADLGSQVALQCLSTHHSRAAFELLNARPAVGHAREPRGIVVFGHQWGAFPHPAARMEPTPQRLRRDRQPACALPGQGQRRTTPTGAAPAIGPRGSFAQGQQRPPPRREQHGCPAGWEESAMLVVLQAQRSLPIGPHRAVYTGTRAEEDQGHIGRVASSRP